MYIDSKCSLGCNELWGVWGWFLKIQCKNRINHFCLLALCLRRFIHTVCMCARAVDGFLYLTFDVSSFIGTLSAAARRTICAKYFTSIAFVCAYTAICVIYHHHHHLHMRLRLRVYATQLLRSILYTIYHKWVDAAAKLNRKYYSRIIYARIRSFHHRHHNRLLNAQT